MRLGQLARKLAVKPVEIVNFLSTKSIQIDSGNNTRIEDVHVILVLQKFAPGELLENVEKAIAEEEKNPEPTIQVDVAAEIPAVHVIEEPKIFTEETKVEVIKAPKVELSGLKVLGKIELPEPKKKEPVVDAEQSELLPTKQDREPRKGNRAFESQRRERQNRTQRPEKNPIALQREREAREAEQKRKDQIERDKEKRTMHYLKKVNVAQPVKAMKRQDDREEEVEVEEASAPTTLWGKFRRWLTT